MSLTRIFQTKKKEKETADTGPKKRVLYVEDIETNWEVCNAYLEDIYEMHHATNSKEAVEMLLAHEFDMILMDIELEGSDMDGITLTQALRGKLESPPDYVREVGTVEMPIIFLTGYTTLYGRSTAHQAGGTDLFGKPVNFDRLMRAMERALAPKTA